MRNNDERAALLQDNRPGENNYMPKMLPLSNTIFGKWQNQLNVEFLVVATAASVVLMGFSGHRISVLKTQGLPMSSEIVMLLSEVFSLYYIFHGILEKRFQEIIIYIIATLLDVIYCTVDFDRMTTPGSFEKARLGVDWTVGCFIPCVVGYLVIRKNFAAIRNASPKEWLDSLLVFDLQLQASSAVFIVTDRQLEVEELAVLILGLLFSLAFCVVGKLLYSQANQKCLRYFFMGLGTTPFLVMIYKTIKQRDGIASGVYLDVASLVFSGLAVVIRLVVLCLGCCTDEEIDEERRHLNPGQSAPAGDNLVDMHNGRSV